MDKYVIKILVFIMLLFSVNYGVYTIQYPSARFRDSLRVDSLENAELLGANADGKIIKVLATSHINGVANYLAQFTTQTSIGTCGVYYDPSTSNITMPGYFFFFDSIETNTGIIKLGSDNVLYMAVGSAEADSGAWIGIHGINADVPGDLYISSANAGGLKFFSYEPIRTNTTLYIGGGDTINGLSLSYQVGDNCGVISAPYDADSKLNLIAGYGTSYASHGIELTGSKIIHKDSVIVNGTTPQVLFQIDGTDVPNSSDWNADDDQFAILSQDAYATIVGTDDGAWCSGISFKQVGEADNYFDNCWGIVRETNDAGAGDGDLHFLYGASTSPQSNTTMLRLTTSGDLHLTGSLYGSINGISGTSGYLSKFGSDNSLENSVIYQTSGNLGIGTITPLNILSYTYSSGKHINLYNSGISRLTIQGNTPGINIVDIGGNTDEKWMFNSVDGNYWFLSSINDNGSTNLSHIFDINLTTGASTFEYTVNLQTVVDAGTDPDKFLCLDASGDIDYRTGANVLSDLSGDAGSSFNWNLQNLDNVLRIGIGTVTNSSYSSYIYHGSDADIISILSGEDKTSEYLGIGIDANEAIITAGHGSDAGNTNLKVRTSNAGSENVVATFTYDAKLGLGTTSPGAILHVYDGSSAGTFVSESKLIIEDNGNVALQFSVPSGSVETIAFGDAGDNDVGKIIYSHSDNSLHLVANANKAIVLKSTGVVNIEDPPVYADNATAITGGLSTGDIYRTSTGQLMVVY